MSARPGPVRHIPELDALRGLAAAAVVLHHWSVTFDVRHGPYEGAGQVISWIRHSALIAGYQPVILFFVLSGFVLGLPYVEGRAPAPGLFIIKRICRIYVPYLVALAVALLAMHEFGGPPRPELSAWFNAVWQDVTRADIRNHVLFVGSYNNSRIDPVLWSLVHEMRVSLMFPWLALLWGARSWRANVVLALAAFAIGGAGQVIMAVTRTPFDGFVTIDTIGSVGVGFLLARYCDALQHRLTAMSTGARVMLCAIGLLAYVFADHLPSWLWFFKSMPATAAAAILMVAAVNRPWLSAWLRRPWPQFMGRISYSVYLYHAVVLLAVLHTGMGRAPMPWLIAFAAIATIAISYASYRWVESPAIRLARRLTAAR